MNYLYIPQLSLGHPFQYRLVHWSLFGFPLFSLFQLHGLVYDHAIGYMVH